MQPALAFAALEVVAAIGLHDWGTSRRRISGERTLVQGKRIGENRRFIAQGS